MDPRSERLISQILNPVAMGSGAATPENPAARMSLEEIVQPSYACGGYTGPERRAQGYLIAEVVEDAPANRPPTRA